MHHATFLFYTLSLTAVVYGNSEQFGIHGSSLFQSTCNKIEAAVSNASEVFFPCMSSRIMAIRADREIKRLPNILPTSHIPMCRVLNIPLALWSLAQRRM